MKGFKNRSFSGCMSFFLALSIGCTSFTTMDTKCIAVSDGVSAFDFAYSKIDGKNYKLTKWNDTSVRDLDLSAVEEQLSSKVEEDKVKITSIADKAFEGCKNLSLDSINLNNVQEIGVDAFEKSVLPLNDDGACVIEGWLLRVDDDAEYLTIDESVKNIAYGVFKSCKAKEAVVDEGSNFAYDESGYILSGNGRRIIAALPECMQEVTTLPEGNVGTLDPYAFVACDKVCVFNVPENISTVKDNVWVNCKNLKYVVFTGDYNSKKLEFKGKNPIIEANDAETRFCVHGTYKKDNVTGLIDPRIWYDVSFKDYEYKPYEVTLNGKTGASSGLIPREVFSSEKEEEGPKYRVIVEEDKRLTFKISCQGETSQQKAQQTYLRCNEKTVSPDESGLYSVDVDEDLSISLKGKVINSAEVVGAASLSAGQVKPSSKFDIIGGLNAKVEYRSILNNGLFKDQKTYQMNTGIARWNNQYVAMTAVVLENKVKKGRLYIYKDGVLYKSIDLDYEPGQVSISGNYMILGKSFDVYDLSPLTSGKDPVKLFSLSSLLSGNGAGIALYKRNGVDSIIVADTEGHACVAELSSTKNLEWEPFTIKESGSDKSEYTKDDENKNGEFNTYGCQLIVGEDNAVYLVKFQSRPQDQEVIFKNIKGSALIDAVSQYDLSFDYDSRTITATLYTSKQIENDLDVYSPHFKFGGCADYVGKEKDSKNNEISKFLVFSACYKCGEQLSEGVVVKNNSKQQYGLVKLGMNKNGSSVSNNDITGFVHVEVKNGNKVKAKITDVDGSKIDYEIPAGGSKVIYVPNNDGSSVKRSWKISGKYLKAEDTANNIWVPEDVNFTAITASTETKDVSGADTIQYNCVCKIPDISKDSLVRKITISPQNQDMQSCQLNFKTKTYNWSHATRVNSNISMYVSKNLGAVTLFKATGTNDEVKSGTTWYVGKDVSTTENWDTYSPAFGTSWGKFRYTIKRTDSADKWGFYYITFKINGKRYTWERGEVSNIEIYVPNEVTSLQNFFACSNDFLYKRCDGYSWKKAGWYCYDDYYRKYYKADNFGISSNGTLNMNMQNNTVLHWTNNIGYKRGRNASPWPTRGKMSTNWDWNSMKKYIERNDW